MTDFLTLVNDTARESGTVSTTQALATVVGATGRQEKIVSHVREAWRAIQTSRTDWDWRRASFIGDLVVGQTEYAASEFSITDFESWEKPSKEYNPFSVYDNSIGRADESYLTFVDHRYWRQNFDFGAPDNNRPNVYAFGSNRKLCVGSPPDLAYKLRGSYIMSPQVLTADADEPICPDGHHEIIMWRALMLLSGHDEAREAYAHAQTQYSSCLRNLVQLNSQLIELA